jgi:hypothetical protein
VRPFGLALMDEHVKRSRGGNLSHSVLTSCTRRLLTVYPVVISRLCRPRPAIASHLSLLTSHISPLTSHLLPSTAPTSEPKKT